MSDPKPRRPARPAATSAIAAGEAMPQDVVPIVAPEPAVAEQSGLVATGALEAGGVAAAGMPTLPPAVDHAWMALAEAQAALARGLESAAIEMTGMTRSGFVATADAAIAMLRVRTVAEAVQINAGLARRGVDTLLAGSARLSEIGVNVVAQASLPILSRLGGPRSGAAG